MRHTLFLCSLFLLAFQQQCNLTSPDSVKQVTESHLRGYFPNAVVTPHPEKEVIIAVTCTQGIGPDLLQQLQQHIAQDRDLANKLALAQIAFKATGVNYRNILLFFDAGVIQYDLVAHQVAVHPLLPKAIEGYKTTCGF